MADKRLKASDKTVQKMNRDGVTEQNLSTGEKQRVTSREQDFSLKNPATDGRPSTHTPTAAHKPRAEATAPGTPLSGTPKTQPRAEPDTPTAARSPANANKPPVDNPTVTYTRESKLRHAEAKVESTEKKLDAVHKKQPHKKRLVSEMVTDEKTQKVKKRLHFEDIPVTAKNPRLITEGAKAAGGVAALGIHRKLYQAEGDNVGLKAAHRTEMGAEGAARLANRYRRARPQRLAKRAVKMEKQVAKAKANLRFEQAVKKNPMLAKQSAVRKYMQKKALRRKYIKQAKKQAKKAAKKTAKEAEKTTQRIIMFIGRHPIVALIIALALVIILLFQSCMNGGMAFVGTGGGALLGGFYPAQDYDINQAELYYTEKETDLYFSAHKLETDNPGYDEYRYIGDVSHNPNTLIAYLCAVYGEFTFNAVKPQLDALFNEQYALASVAVTETKTRTKADGTTEEYEWKVFVITITNHSLVSVVTPKMTAEQSQVYAATLALRGGHFYFSSPLSEGWLGRVSSGYGWRVSPTTGAKALHDGIDIAIPTGTAVLSAQNGKVTLAGANGDLGICVIIESADGLKSVCGHLNSVSVRVGQTVTRGAEIGKSGNTGNSTGPHLHLSVYKNGQSFNPLFFVDSGLSLSN